MPKKTEIWNDSRTVGARKHANEERGHFVPLSIPECKSNMGSGFCGPRKKNMHKKARSNQKNMVEYVISLHSMYYQNVLFTRKQSLNIFKVVYKLP